MEGGDEGARASAGGAPVGRRLTTRAAGDCTRHVHVHVVGGQRGTTTTSPQLRGEPQRHGARARTNLAKGSFLMSSSVDFWYCRISRSARMPGRARGFLLLAPSLAGRATKRSGRLCLVRAMAARGCHVTGSHSGEARRRQPGGRSLPARARRHRLRPRSGDRSPVAGRRRRAADTAAAHRAAGGLKIQQEARDVGRQALDRCPQRSAMGAASPKDAPPRRARLKGVVQTNGNNRAQKPTKKTM